MSVCSGKVLPVGKTVAFSLALVLAFGLRADIHTWCGGNHAGGGWNDPANWKNPAGENEVPAAGDTAVITYTNENYDKVTANDDDMPLLVTLGKIDVLKTTWVEPYDCSELIFDVTNDWTVTLPVRALADYSAYPEYGSGVAGGALRKRGRGTLTLTNDDEAHGKHYVYLVTYLAYRGWFVEEGTVVFPQDTGKKFGFYDITVAEGSEVRLPNDADIAILGLRGAGTVVGPSNPDSPSIKPTLSFGYAIGNKSDADFSGVLSGDCNLTVGTAQRFSGVNNTISGPNIRIWHRLTTEFPCGEMGLVRIGSFGDAESSVGPGKTLANDLRSIVMYGNGKLVYLGAGETTDRRLYFYPNHAELTAKYDGYAPFVVDAGATGGIRFEGMWKFVEVGEPNLSILCLEGSNTVPCTIAGEFISTFTSTSAKPGTYTPTIVKRGSGTWRFADSPLRTQLCGVFEVAEGTLQYDTIAPSNVVCSLGMSTLRYSKLVGPLTDATAVPYAFLLGRTNATAAAVFEFTGSRSCASRDRPIALAADAHIRASGTDGAAISLAGISTVGPGLKLLTLDGTNTAENVLSEVTDGEGRLGLVKNGPGNWTLTGDIDFSGPIDVRAGTLRIEGQKAFSYFRATFSDYSGSSAGCFLNELALYDADGVRRNMNLAHRWPADPVTLNGWTKIYLANYVPPAAGEIAYEPLAANGTSLYHYYRSDSSGKGGTPDCLTDGTSTRYCSFETSPVPSPDYPIAVTMHLPEGTPEIVSVDMCQYGSDYQGKGFQSPTNLVLEGSVDGRAPWTTLVSTNSLTPNMSSTQWYFSDSKDTVANSPSNRTLSAGETLTFMTRAVSTAYEQLPHPGAVSVAAGATFVYDGLEPLVLDALAVDVNDGMGTLRGFALKPGMTLDVRGVDKRVQEYVIPVDLSQCAGAENVTWTYTIDGATPKRHSVELRDGKLYVRKHGLAILLR